MRYQVEWSRQALRDVKRLDKQLVNRIVSAVQMFAETGYGDIKKLTNAGEQYRLRVGDWRVLFYLEGDELRIMLISGVLPRGQAYKR